MVQIRSAAAEPQPADVQGATERRLHPQIGEAQTARPVQPHAGQREAQGAGRLRLRFGRGVRGLEQRQGAGSAVAVQYHGSIVIQAGGAPLEYRGHDHDTVAGSHCRQGIGCWTRDRFCQCEVPCIFRLAEIATAM